MIALVTGAAGFIGSHLVDELVSQDHRVIIIDNLTTGTPSNLTTYHNHPLVTFFQKSVTENLSEVFSHNAIDCIFHLAAIPNVQFSIDHPTQTHETNVNGTLNLLENARKYKTQRFIFSSSAAVYGEPKQIPTSESCETNPLSPYALQKLISEEYLKLYTELYGMETVVLRYFNVYGSRQNAKQNYAGLIPKFIDKINHNKTITINGDGSQTRDFVHVSDAIAANIMAATIPFSEKACRIMNIGSGTNVTVNEITNILLKSMQSEMKPEHGKPVKEPKN